MSSGGTPDESTAPDSNAAVQQECARHVEGLIAAVSLLPERVQQLHQVQVIGSGLSPAVADILARRERAGLHNAIQPAPSQRASDFRGNLGSLAAIVGGLMLLVGVADGLAGVSDILLAILGGVAFSGGVMGFWAAGRRLARDPLHLSDNQYFEVQRHEQTVGWSGTALLTHPPAEAAIVLVAQDIITGICTSPVGADQSLDVHRIRLNLNEEYRQILIGAYRLSRFTAETLEPAEAGGAGYDSDRWQAALDQRAGLTTAMRRALVERVAALYCYRDGLRPMETLLDDIALVRKLDAEQTELAAAYTDIVNNEQATAHLAKLTAELTDLEAGLLARIDYLRTGVINNPALSTPLAVSPATEGR